MISKKTIEEVKDLPIEEVISKHMEIKQAGANYKGCCPFHEEKTPSFTVSPAKGLYKCFGCGKAGGNISFVMDKEGLTFPEAVTRIAEMFGIHVEKDDSDDAREYVKKQAEREKLADINIYALEVFTENFKEIEEGFTRASKKMVELFSIGYANEDYKNILHRSLEKGYAKKDLIDVGLVTKTAKGEFDFFNKRTIFPIYDHQNRIIGFGGRDEDWSKEKSKGPKYLNTKETNLFNKSKALYGIHLAKQEARKKDLMYIVEGYYDVIAMHEIGLTNSVAPCGTSFTLEQATLIKKRKWAKTICLLFDGDKAGEKAAERTVPMLVALGFNVEVVFLPEGEDPDSYKKELKKYLESNKIDGVVWIANKFFEGAKGVKATAEAESKLETLLATIGNTKIRNGYIKSLHKEYNITKTDLEKNVRQIIIDNVKNQEENGLIKLPNGVDRDEYEKFGFYEIEKKGNPNTGYYFINQSSNFEKRSNFIIKPLFHIYSKVDNKRLIKIVNHRVEKIIDVPSKGFVGQTQFLEAVIDEGNFWFHGTKSNFQRVMVKILEKFPRCEEIKTLGWQDEGFYSFANGIIDGRFKPVDTYGIVQFGDNQYFLPAFSNVYKDVRSEDDLYENERHFIYRKSPVNFEEWAKQFVRVHGDNGKIAIAYLISSLFRDYIYSQHKVFPHLYGFGGISTGKSYMARSLNSIFHGGEPGFNLTTGTLVGMNRKLAQFKNAIIWFDEYGNDLEKLRFDRLKGAYDGLGHEKGVMSHDNRTKKTNVNSGCVITGQYLPTRDDNSLFSRCLLLTFDKKAEQLSSEDIKEGAKLKEWENKGLSDIIIDILQFRDLILERFNTENFEVQKDLKEALAQDDFQGRISFNFSLVLTPIKILADKIRLPFTYEEVFNQSVQMIIKQSEQVHDSDALNTFWKMVEYLFAMGQITNEMDFKIRTMNELNVKVDRKSSELKNFKTPVKMLFIRLTKIHPLYMSEHRKQHGENGVGDGSIKQYMKSNKAFLGLCPATQFDDAKTSAYVFDYDMVGLELESMKKANTPPPLNDDADGELVGASDDNDKDELPF